MSFKFESPVKWPRMTTEDFRKKKEEYTAKYGYTIHIPAFEDIIKWDTTPEPTKEELEQYRREDYKALGFKRFEDIRQLLGKKRENFLRMLASPAPNIIHNATSILTALDDVNDALGTLVAVGKIAAHRLPKAAFRLFAGPAGWALVAADIAGMALDLSRLPFKARNIQHEINETVRGHPLSKKARVKHMKKIARLRLSKGEIIEGLQTTENMFGIGISLGPIFALLTDIPAGLYHHIKGEKVTITNLPAPLLWFDQIWSRLLKSVATCWTGLPVEFDQDLTKSMVATNLAIQTYRAQFPLFSPIDGLITIEGIMHPAPTPQHPSTKLVVENELGDEKAKTGWAFSGEKYISTKHIYENARDHMYYNLKKWRERNRRDLEGMVGAQNAAEAGLNIMGALETDESLELEYEPVAMSMLNLLNQGFRFPPDITQAQLDTWTGMVDTNYLAWGELLHGDAIRIGRQYAGFEFTTQVMERPFPTYTLLMGAMSELINATKKWHFQRAFRLSSFTTFLWAQWTVERIDGVLTDMNNQLKWLNQHGWPPDEPTKETRDSIAHGRVRLWNQRTSLLSPGAEFVDEPPDYPVLVVRLYKVEVPVEPPPDRPV